MGAFGLLDGWHDHLTPPEQLVEAHPVANVFQLARQGLLTPGVEAHLEGLGGHGGCRLATDEAGKVWIDGQPVRVAWHKALPLRLFICPSCERDCYRLHEVGGRWACRLCHQLTYQSRHRFRTIPGYARALYLRRRIGASPLLFTPLPAKPPWSRRHWKLAREIRAIEARLLQHAREDINQVLEKRYARS